MLCSFSSQTESSLKKASLILDLEKPLRYFLLTPFSVFPTTATRIFFLECLFNA